MTTKTAARGSKKQERQQPRPGGGGLARAGSSSKERRARPTGGQENGAVADGAEGMTIRIVFVPTRMRYSCDGSDTDSSDDIDLSAAAAAPPPRLVTLRRGDATLAAASQLAADAFEITGASRAKVERRAAASRARANDSWRRIVNRYQTILTRLRRRVCA